MRARRPDANYRARAAAQKAGRDTYQHEVVDYWPACSACGVPIRCNVETGRAGLRRSCGCPGVVWELGMTTGWEKVPAAVSAAHPADDPPRGLT